MTQPQLFEYSADYVDIDYGGVILTGYADTFIEVEYHEPDFKMHKGSLGDVARSRLLDRTGKITVTLMDVSASNDQLMAFAANDRKKGRGFKPFKMRDRSSNTTIQATQAWIEKIPKVGRGKESGTTVWVFECAFLDINVGSSVLGAT
jgi:hypothetical protein